MAINKNDTKGYKAPFAVHPGETIREALEFVRMSQTDLAARIDLSEKTVSLILNNLHPVSAETALKLERALGLSDKLLLQMQAFFDADTFRLEEEKRLAHEVKYLPKYSFYNELSNYGYVNQTKNKIEKVEELLRFFGINSLSTVPNVFPVAYRQTGVLERMSEEATAAWLQIGSKVAQTREVSEFNRQKLLENIPKMRSLTRESANTYCQALIDLCAEAGIVLVYTPHLKNTCINGAVQWISPTKVLVQLSLYYSYADIFWFSLFHELGHVLKHSKKETFVEFTKHPGKVSELEKEADLFAGRVLIPTQLELQYEALKHSLTPSSYAMSIKQFSDSAGIDIGIVAGRIGHDLSLWKPMSRFRKRLVFKKE